MKDVQGAGVQTTKHARKRAEQRFDIPYKQTARWLRQKFEHATYITDMIDDSGNIARLFVSSGVLLAVDKDVDRIITVMTPNWTGETRTRMRKFARQEITKEQTKERRRLNAITRLQAEIEIEIGELRLRLLKTRSLPKKLAIQGRIKALKMRLDELPQEEHVIKRKRVSAVKSLARVW
ncbi:hypothetical protein [Virgibacillus proomii]|uniref:hypothetical protein n=1 Tax=Virgibacillus proomii TaxID=84407 RepID=UPI001C103043|nr:hypothetical protein [Virgibacillus proomii]MBU5266243.1 hypothetical protein [Virgibacillus proomii]